MRSVALCVVSTLALAGCVEQTYCELAGCRSQLAVDVPALGDEAFTVAIDSPTIVGTFRCPALDADGNRAAPLEATGDIVTGDPAQAPDDVAVAAGCETRGASVAVFRRGVDASEVLPASATVTVTSEARSFTADADAITYGVHQPNGPDCEPTCLSATLVAEEE